MGERKENNARSVGETESKLVQRRDVLLVEVTVVDEVALGEVGDRVNVDGSVKERSSVVVGNVGGDGEGKLSAWVDVAVDDGRHRRSSFNTGEVGEEDRRDVRVVGEVAEVDRARSGDDDDGVVVAVGDVVDELVSAVGEL
jgi:hypothetical protein